MKIFTNIPEPTRTVVITEEQARMLKEATDGQFSTDELSKLQSFDEKVEYCRRHLGEEIGQGSSRIVFQIDDEKVLKLAFNEKGKAQNVEEYQPWKEKYDFIPKIFDADYTNDDWIICEYVLPAEEKDFEHCLGITWSEFDDFVHTVFSQFSNFYIGHDLDYDEVQQMTENSEMLSELYMYITDMCFLNGDIVKIENWGLAKRNGDAYLVFLDHGFSESVNRQFYMRKF